MKVTRRHFKLAGYIILSIIIGYALSFLLFPDMWFLPLQVTWLIWIFDTIGLDVIAGCNMLGCEATALGNLLGIISTSVSIYVMFQILRKVR